MDAFALALSYGIIKVSNIKAILTAIIVGIFHFFMPLLGNKLGISIFSYTTFKPKYILFLVFIMLSLDMFISFFEKDKCLRPLNLLGIIFFAISVSLDSFSVGIGISYMYDNIILVVSTFCIVSLLFTFLGFKLGKTLFNKFGKYAFLLGSITLFMYNWCCYVS